MNIHFLFTKLSKHGLCGLFVTMLTLFILPSLSAQNSVFVSASAENDNGDGTTWATAKKTMEAALTLVGSNGTVFVKAGTYNLTGELTIPASVTVLGGYSPAALGTDTSQRNLPGVNSHWQDDTYCSILMGDGTFRIATVQGMLDGCIVRNGFTTTIGGGTLIDGGTVRYCVIMGCDAVAEDDASAEGGGAYIRNNGTLINCVVTECRGDNGSAVSGEDGSLINNTITRNWPSQCGTVTDYDGNVYNTVRLGHQCWMRENLRTTHYADGTAIPTSSNSSSTEPYYYQGGNLLQDGLYYNWTAVMNGAGQTNANPSGVQGVCPTGWHVPSAAEWIELSDFVASVPNYRCGTGSNTITKALSSRTNWNNSSYACTPGNNQSINNATRFNAMPAGYRGFNGNFSDSGSGVLFTSATNYDYAANSGSIMVYGYWRDWGSWGWRTGYYEYDKATGLNVRCVKNEE